ncbi:unnamed protein product [Linum tenue]|uniref:Bromodomain associated domain-containing protein n=1 Tax=Linum tenue TaxID=586396 RepID=A0AAV0I8T0_9ROSI|nr:unnamed protein product [Linum tenue]
MRTRSSLRHPKTPSAAAAALPPPPPESNPSDCANGIARIAVAQVCQSVGFKSAEGPALETLTRVAGLYLKTLAKAAASYSGDSNRTESNAFDVVNALHELESAQGFAGASDPRGCCLVRSSVVKDAQRFLNTIDEIPFAKPIPRADGSGSSPAPPCSGARPRGKHIPDWLPDFPEESTYREEGCEGIVEGRDVELALWERTISCGGEGEGVGAGGKTGEGSGGELRRERERVKFQICKREEATLIAKKRRTMGR